ncbi:hypothetical protein ACOSQ2_014872 [Xanthoceras sorbifolium]
MNYDNELDFLHPPPDLPEEFRSMIDKLNGTDIMLVIQKNITETDMDTKLNCLSVPRKQVRAEFMTEEEKQRLEKKQGREVLMIQPCLEEAKEITLQKWNMSETILIKRNQLKQGSLVQLWSFRIPKESNSMLGFALVNLSMREQI